MKKYIFISVLLTIGILAINSWSWEGPARTEEDVRRRQEHQDITQGFQKITEAIQYQQPLPVFIPRQEPIYIPTTDPAIQTAVNRLQLENQEDLRRIQSLEKTTVELQDKVKRVESLLKIQNARNIELEKKVKLLRRAELKRRNQRE